MIGWLQGQLQDTWQQAQRFGLLLNCQGVGYEVQVSQRLWAHLPPRGDRLTLHVHQTIRDEAWILFGFGSRQERDLFREVVAVSGVGPQMGLALLGALGMEDLVRAIAAGDTRLLCQAQGVGKRTAERLCLELRQKLHERAAFPVASPAGAPSPAAQPPAPGEGSRGMEDLQSTLVAMGYERVDIQAALKAVAAQGLDLEADGDQWLGDCLRWLSRAAA